jgi:large subunit ribosomal protein L54
LSTPLGGSEGGGGAAAPAEALSSCPEGTVLTGLNYFKNKTDPVALADDAYPAWLWKCLDVQKKADEGEADEAGDEFCKSSLILVGRPQTVLILLPNTHQELP